MFLKLVAIDYYIENRDLKSAENILENINRSDFIDRKKLADLFFSLEMYESALKIYNSLAVTQELIFRMAVINKELNYKDESLRLFNLINDSNLLIHQVEKASWNIFKPEMTYIDNILVNDMTKTGILFKLWNSIRLNKNTKNLYLMLKYLETLIKDESKNFEEFFYYLNDLKSQKNLEKNHIELLNKYKTKYQHNEIKLLKSVGNYNLVKRGNKFLIVNQSLGIIDFINEKIGEREIPNYIEIFDTESEAIKSIEKK